MGLGKIELKADWEKSPNLTVSSCPVNFSSKEVKPRTGAEQFSRRMSCALRGEREGKEGGY